MTRLTGDDYDVLIIGSGVGGSAVAKQLAGSTARVLILERGPHLPREPKGRGPRTLAFSVFGDATSS